MSTNEIQAAIDYLYSHADYSVERSYRYSADVFELQRVRDLLAALGNPQEQFKSFHIAGTKGKGSVSVFIASIQFLLIRSCNTLKISTRKMV